VARGMHDVDGINTGLARALYEEYLERPDRLPGAWREFFETGRALPGRASRKSLSPAEVAAAMSLVMAHRTHGHSRRLGLRRPAVACKPERGIAERAPPRAGADRARGGLGAPVTRASGSATNGDASGRRESPPLQRPAVALLGGRRLNHHAPLAEGRVIDRRCVRFLSDHGDEP
jgi:hypothetical protein